MKLSISLNFARAKYTMLAFRSKWKYQTLGHDGSRSSKYPELGPFTLVGTLSNDDGDAKDDA